MDAELSANEARGLDGKDPKGAFLKLPTYEDGTEIAIGRRVRLDPGDVIRVAGILFTADGVFVTGKVPGDGDHNFHRVTSPVLDPDDETPEEVEEDFSLQVGAYIKKRALDVSDLDPKERREAVRKDLFARYKKALLRAGAVSAEGAAPDPTVA